MLVGNGALKWARDNNITEVSEDSLKTGILLHALYILQKFKLKLQIENMIKSHQFYMKKLDSYNQNQKQHPQNDLAL